jgi:hypothetical protein
MVHKFIIHDNWVTMKDASNLPEPTLRDCPVLVTWLSETGITDYHLEWIQDEVRSNPGHKRLWFDTAIVFRKPSDATAFKLSFYAR